MSLYKTIKFDIYRVRELQNAQNFDISFLTVLKFLFNFRFVPIVLYRLSFFFTKYRLNFIAKICSFLNIALFGIEISTKVQIGPGLFFPHTVGTVIGAAKIGKNCTIYQGVTLGAKNIDLIYDEKNRPIIGDNVLIASGAKVLGGITIGNNVTIAANAVVLQSVPDNSVMAGIPAHIIKTIN